MIVRRVLVLCGSCWALFFPVLMPPPPLCSGHVLHRFGTVDGPALLEATWTAYAKALRTRPVLTKSATSAVVMGLSDAVAQGFETRFDASASARTADGGGSASGGGGGASSSSSPASRTVGNRLRHRDWNRTGLAALTGFAWSGPVAHCWYEVLERIVRLLGIIPSAADAAPSVAGLLCRLLVDAAVFSPFTIAGYFAVSNLLRGHGWFEIRKKLEASWWRTVTGAWSFWPVANVINFGLVPLEFRVLYANVAALIWSGYLSYVNNSSSNDNNNRGGHHQGDVRAAVGSPKKEAA